MFSLCKRVTTDCNWAWGPITAHKGSKPEMQRHPLSAPLQFAGRTSQRRDFYEYFNSLEGSNWSSVRAASPEISPKPFLTVTLVSKMSVKLFYSLTK